MVLKFLIIAKLSFAQKEFGGGSSGVYTVGKTVEEECFEQPLNYYDASAETCNPCDPYSHADATGTACEADSCEEGQALDIEGKCFYCEAYSYPKDDL